MKSPSGAPGGGDCCDTSGDCDCDCDGGGGGGGVA
jgi:hypothetical protein